MDCLEYLGLRREGSEHRIKVIGLADLTLTDASDQGDLSFVRRSGNHGQRVILQLFVVHWAHAHYYAHGLHLGLVLSHVCLRAMCPEVAGRTFECVRASPSQKRRT
eukprot:scaffold15586_cov100-Isochrysis_galbana.AAC.2